MQRVLRVRGVESAEASVMVCSADGSCEQARLFEHVGSLAGVTLLPGLVVTDDSAERVVRVRIGDPNVGDEGMVMFGTTETRCYRFHGGRTTLWFARRKTDAEAVFAARPSGSLVGLTVPQTMTHESMVVVADGVSLRS